jgi:hypothetical protein
MFCAATDHPFCQTAPDASKSTGDDVCCVAVKCVVQRVGTDNL